MPITDPEKRKAIYKRYYEKHCESVNAKNKERRKDGRYSEADRVRARKNYHADVESSQRKSCEYYKTHCDDLRNNQAVRKMSQQFGIPISDIPAELIETKIAILNVTRKVKELMK